MSHAFGDRVSVTHRLVRRTEYPGGGARKKFWEPVEIVKREFVGRYLKQKVTPDPAEAIVIGIRTLANGETEWLGEGGLLFVASDRFEAYLVATDLRSAPFYVLAEHITSRTD